MQGPPCWALTTYLHGALLGRDLTPGGNHTEKSFPTMDAFPHTPKRAEMRAHFKEPKEHGSTHCGFCGDHGGSDARSLLEQEGKNQKEDWLVKEQ